MSTINPEKYRLAVLMLVKQNDKILLIRKVGKFEWQFPSGGREGAESLTETLEREIEEEFGISMDKISKIHKTFQFVEYEFPDDWKAKRNAFGQRNFISIIHLLDDAELIPDGDEIEEIRFVSSDEVCDAVTHKEALPAIRTLIEEGLI